MKPLISDKTKGSDEITLLENDSIVNDKMLVADILDNYYVNVTRDIGVADDITENDTLEDIISSHESNESIIRIKENVCHGRTFSFAHVSVNDINNKLKRINVKKATGWDMIAPKTN